MSWRLQRSSTRGTSKSRLLPRRYCGLYRRLVACWSRCGGGSGSRVFLFVVISCAFLCSLIHQRRQRRAPAAGQGAREGCAPADVRGGGVDIFQRRRPPRQQTRARRTRRTGEGAPAADDAEARGGCGEAAWRAPSAACGFIGGGGRGGGGKRDRHCRHRSDCGSLAAVLQPSTSSSELKGDALYC